jgi:HTH-type transcriptional regulator/antitoxin HipB
MRIHSAKDLGALVRTHRKKRGWTQKQLASEVGVQALWISQFERGKTTAQIGLVFRTLRALDLSLFTGDPLAVGGDRESVIDLDAIVRPRAEASKVAEPGSTSTPRLRDSDQ